MFNTHYFSHIKLFFSFSLLIFLLQPLKATDYIDGEISKAQITYFSAQLPMSYAPDMVIDQRTCTSDRCLKKFYKKMEASNYQILLLELEHTREKMELSDWFFYQLVRKTTEQICEEKSEVYKTLFTWFLMNKSGYDTRINTANNQYVFLYVRTKDKVFYTPFIRPDDGEKYVNLTSMYYGIDSRRVLFEMSDFKPESDNKHFSFALNQLPDLPPQIEETTLTYEYAGEVKELKVEVDTTIRTMMRGYPVVNDAYYFEVPFSTTVKNSLLPQLREVLADKTPKEQAEILVSITRRSFEYAWDYEVYDQAQPMIAEEVLLRNVSDHEDRCALFFYLAKELTDLDVIVIFYYDSYHTIGVALPEAVGEAVEYKGQNYYICDPTEPFNSSKIGKIPTAFRAMENKIIAELDQ